jgi:hypothetical protein
VSLTPDGRLRGDDRGRTGWVYARRCTSTTMCNMCVTCIHNDIMCMCVCENVSILRRFSRRWTCRHVPAGAASWKKKDESHIVFHLPLVVILRHDIYTLDNRNSSCHKIRILFHHFFRLGNLHEYVNNMYTFDILIRYLMAELFANFIHGHFFDPKHGGWALIVW